MQQLADLHGSSVRTSSEASVDTDAFLTTEQAAAIPQVHPQTVREAYRAGRLRGIKINQGRVLRFRRSWVIAWLEGVRS